MKIVVFILNAIAFHLTIFALISFHLAQLVLFPIRLVSRPWFVRIESMAVRLSCIWHRVITYIFTGGHMEIHTYGNEQQLNAFRKRIHKEPLNVLVLANHTSSMDWIAMYHLFDRLGVSGYIRFMMKVQHASVPVIGWGAALRDMIFLKKDLKQDQETIISALKSFKEEVKQPYWVLLYPEGTYVTPNSIQLLHKSQAWAKKNHLHQHQLDYVLSPRVGAVSLCLGAASETTTGAAGSRIPFDLILDVTTAYKGAKCEQKLGVSHPPSMVTMYQYRSKDPLDVHVHLQVFDPVADCHANNEEQLKEWLLNRYTEKDDLLRYFERKGAFPSSAHTKQPSTYPISTSNVTLFDWVCFSLTTFFYMFIGHYIYHRTILFWIAVLLETCHIGLSAFVIYYDYIHNSRAVVHPTGKKS